MRVLCFGSLNIDYTYRVPHFVQKGETISSESLQVFPGGKGLNQSLALAKAGAKTCQAGAVGTDGQFLLDLLVSGGVDASYITMLDEVRTGNAIIQNDHEGDNCIILYGGANQAITREQVDTVLADFEAGDYLVLQNEINELDYIMERAHNRGMKIVLNPSPMNDKIMVLPLIYVDYFLLNEIEAGQILGIDILEGYDGVAMAADLRRKYPGSAVVLTMGGDGSVYADESETFTQSIYKVKAVDTTAAGDTFSGYFIAALLEGKSKKDAMNLAAKAAAIAVTRRGAAPSIPTPEELDSFF